MFTRKLFIYSLTKPNPQRRTHLLRLRHGAHGGKMGIARQHEGAGMTRVIAQILAATVALSAASPVWADILARVSKTEQTMDVYVDGELYATWPVSTARRGYVTPSGVFRPQTLARHHRSSRYNGSPMPHSVFFHGNYAIHGSYHVRSLGRPASHGCIRLSPENAREFYNLVSERPEQTRIVVER
jgi:lipoprotein-anchoring transpeptidase ErfK/SrfK